MPPRRCWTTWSRPWWPTFCDAYPLVRLELTAAKPSIDLIEERADLAIRIGTLADSTLNARRLGASRLRLLASPGYLARHGTPDDRRRASRGTGCWASRRRRR